MTKSILTVKDQTKTPSDVLQEEVVGDHARVTMAEAAFLKREGSIKVGPGDPAEDVRKARELLGLKGL